MATMSNTGEFIYSRLAKDPDLRDIVEMFVDEMPERLANLTSFFDSGDLEGLRRTAHQLKGAAGSYGFDPISPGAGQLESAIQNGEPLERIREILAELVEICGRVRCNKPE